MVLLRGTVRFDGAVAQLAATATGRVWLSDHSPTGARIFWPTADGRYRVLGERPPGAEPVAPSVEDGCLLLIGEGADPRVAA